MRTKVVSDISNRGEWAQREAKKDGLGLKLGRNP